MPRSVRCPALFVGAPASHQGKTTLTAGIARHHRKLGRQVRVFKTGPDFLDPRILEAASGHPVDALDLWMNGEADCRQRLHAAACAADLILIEGSMGLFDGTPSGADLAGRFGVPVALVMDASGMAQTFAAIAAGLAAFRPDLPFAGVLANRVASPRHAALLQDNWPATLPWLGAVGQDAAMVLPERHLGLVEAREVPDLDARIERAAARIADTQLARLPAPVRFDAPPATPLPRRLDGVRIAIARDAAFSFLYPANLDCLAAMGAELRFFSPLADTALPACDAVWLPGGYPELHRDRLAGAHALIADLKRHVAAGRPLHAECGGMLFLLDTLDGQPMAGLLPGSARLQSRLAGLGLQSLTLDGLTLRGHTFHYSRTDTPLVPLTHAERAGGGQGEAVYRHGPVTASYFHAYFPSCPEAAARLFLP